MDGAARHPALSRVLTRGRTVLSEKICSTSTLPVRQHPACTSSSALSHPEPVFTTELLCGDAVNTGGKQPYEIWPSRPKASLPGHFLLDRTLVIGELVITMHTCRQRDETQLETRKGCRCGAGRHIRTFTHMTNPLKKGAGEETVQTA